MPTKQKLDACAAFQQEGNAYHAEGQYYRASERYRKALVYFEYTFTETPEEERRLEELRVNSRRRQAQDTLRLEGHDRTAPRPELRLAIRHIRHSRALLVGAAESSGCIPEHKAIDARETSSQPFGEARGAGKDAGRPHLEARLP